MSTQRLEITIYRNRRTGEFKIHPHARNFGTPQEFGAPTVLSEDVADETLLEAILQNLSKTNTQKYDLALAPKYSSEEQRRRLKEDQLIGVRQLADKFEVVPFQRVRGSFGSIDEMTKIVSHIEFASRGGTIIRQMFRDMLR